MLMIPPKPSASYFAPGLVMTSTDFISLAGIDCNTSAIFEPKAILGLPLIKNRMLEVPANCTLPSISTETMGIFFNKSVATPLCALISFSALKTILSILFSISLEELVTVTSFKVLLAFSNKIVFKFIFR